MKKIFDIRKRKRKIKINEMKENFNLTDKLDNASIIYRLLNFFEIT